MGSGSQWILDVGVKLNEKQVLDLKKQVEIITKSKQNIVIGISAGEAKAVTSAFEAQNKATASIKENLNLSNKQMTQFNSGIKQSASLVNKVSDGYKKIERDLTLLQQKNKKAFSTGNFDSQLGNLQGMMGKYQSSDMGTQLSMLKQMNSTYKDLAGSVTTYNQAEKSFGSQIARRFVQYTVAARGFFMLISTAQKMIDNVKDLDKSLVEVQKVTNLAGKELEVFASKAFAAGSEVARTGKEIIDSAAVFARSGYSISESLDLAKESAVLLNVADNMENIEEASQTLISTLKAYNLETTDARKVTDIFNEVSNNSAISFDDLTEAIRRSGAVFAQSNTSIEQFSALITGTNEIIQNVEKSSTGLNTISLRLRG